MRNSASSILAIDRRVLRWSSLILFIVVAIYITHGSARMFKESEDYRIHWVEERYVYRGKNPADIRARIDAVKQNLPIPIPENGRDNSMDPDLGVADGAYPLSSYFTATIFTWPQTLASGRSYNSVLNLLSLLLLGFWVYQLGEKEISGGGLLFVASFLAVNSVSTTLIVGQYGVPVLLALYGMMLFAEKNRDIWTGICFGIAMIKLSIAAPFALPFMAKNRWRPLFVGGAYLVIATAIMWPLIQTNPIHVFQQTTHAAGNWQSDGYSLNNLFEAAGISSQPAMKLAAVLTMGLALVTMYVWRASSLLTHFGIAAVASRAWCYHRQYDNLIIIFLLLALGVTAFRSGSWIVLSGWLLVGLSLWLPAELTDYIVWDCTQWLTWLIGLTVLLYGESVNRLPIEVIHEVSQRQIASV